MDLAGVAVAIGEGDVVAIVDHDAFGAEGGAVDIGGEVFQCGFSRADGLNVYDPVLGPDVAGDVSEGFGALALHGHLEASAEAHRQGGLWEEVVGVFGTNPAKSLGGETSGWDYTVDVGMEAQVAGPGLEHGQETDLGPEVLVVASDILQSASGLADQGAVKAALFRTDEP